MTMSEDDEAEGLSDLVVVIHLSVENYVNSQKNKMFHSRCSRMEEFEETEV